MSAKISEEVRSMHTQGNFSLGVSDGTGDIPQFVESQNTFTVS